MKSIANNVRPYIYIYIGETKRKLAVRINEHKNNA